MQGQTRERPDHAPMVPRNASVAANHAAPAKALAEQLGTGPFALILLFVSLEADLPLLLKGMEAAYPGAAIAGCTTAGEISENGYETGRIVALGFPEAGFVALPVAVEHIDRLDPSRIVDEVLAARQSLGQRGENLSHEFAILLVDGLSGQEESLVSAVTGGLGSTTLIGGSAGDAGHFDNAAVFAHGRVLENAAILCLLRSRGEVRNFSLDHTRPSAARMIVTAADPASRSVLRINDEPAAVEYARQIGLPVESLSSYVFATQPVLVRAGGRYHVRSIRDVGPNQSLVFFSAIGEGMVLTISEPGDIAQHLESELASFTRLESPELILGFDCIFRRIDAEGRQRGAEVSRILSRHHVIGFSTYGEQYGALHMNQTLTGIAFYPPEAPE